MPRNITVTFADGSTHVYQNAPDNVTPDQVSARAARDFGKPVKSLDGGRGAAPAQPAAAPQRKVSAIQGPKPAPADPKVQAYAMERYKQARQIVVRNMAGRSPEEQQRALNRFDTDPRVQPLRQMAGMPTLQTRQQAIQEAGRKAAQKGPRTYGAALTAGISRSLFGLPERAAAGWLYYTGQSGNLDYGETLDAVRAKTDAQMEMAPKTALVGQIGGSMVGGGVAGRTVGRLGGRLAASSVPAAAKAGNVLQTVVTLKKGQRLANAGKIVLAGGAAGGAQAAGEGKNVVTGAAEGAGGAAVLGTGFKAAQILTRPLRDVLRTSSAGRILSRLTTATKDQLEAKAAAYRDATGAEPTVFELLPLADRNKILGHAIVGRDSVVEATSGAIRKRAANLGPEMSAKARQVLEPARSAARVKLVDDLATARGGQNAPEDLALANRAMNSPTDMAEFRDVEARAIMAPHDNTPVAKDFEELIPQTPENVRGTIVMKEADPAVSAAIRSAAPGGFRKGNQGVTAGDISDMIQTLRGDLSKGGIEGRTAQRAIDHLEGELAARAPDAAAAHAQMTDAYAARSRMMEGLQEGNATRLRDTVQIGTSRSQARKVRNAYDTPEGATGRNLGQGNRVITDLGGSPEEALRSTVKMSRNSIGRELGQNVGTDESAKIMAAAHAQDESAQALAAASNKAQSGSGNTADPEMLVQAIAGLHPSSFITTKAGAMRKLLDMTYIPENRARTIVDMIFSQDPAMTRKALDAIRNEPNGAAFMQYLAGVTGNLAASSGVPDTGGSSADTPAPSVEADLQAGDAENPDETSQEPGEEGASPYDQMLQTVYETEDPDLLDLIDRVSGQESGGQQFDENGNPLASSKGAIGVMQVMPGTAPEAAKLAGLPWDENAYYHDASYNKLLGIAYLSDLLRRYDGDVEKALAAYNAGPGRLEDATSSGNPNWLAAMPAETQDYVARIS